MPQHNKEQLVQTYQEKTVELQEKSKHIETMSDTDKHELSAEIEATLSDLKKDMEVLDVTVDASEKSQLVNFETQLITIRNTFTGASNSRTTGRGVDTSTGEVVEPEEDKNFFQKSWEWIKGKADDAGEWVKENRGWTALGVGTLGLGFLAYRWYKKRKEKKETSAVAMASNNGQQAPIIINTGEKKNRWQRNWGWVVGTLGLAGVGYAFRDKLSQIPYV